MSSLDELPKRFVEDFFMARRKFVEEALEKGFDERRVLEMSTRLALMVATCGPAGVNVAPFMVSFVVKESEIESVVEKLDSFLRKPGEKSFEEALKLLLDTVYNPELVDPLKLVTHVMSKGHTWANIKASGKASLGILIPPDKGAYEIRAKAEILEQGAIYKYANMVHDLVHVAPHGERSHPWYPALLFTIEEIYDNSYEALGRKIYP